MSVLRIRFAVLCITMCSLCALGADTTRPNDTCLMFVARNISNPGPNFFLYYAFSGKRVDFRKGDVLEYDIYLSKSNPLPCGGIDVETLSDSLRDSQVTDQNGLSAHPNTNLPQAMGHWYHRQIPLDKLAGQRARRWSVAAEGDTRGTYVQFYDHVVVQHANGSQTVIYSGGPAGMHEVLRKEGYSKSVILRPVDRAAVKDNVDLNSFVDAEVRQFSLQAKLDDLRGQIALADKVSQLVQDQQFIGRVAEVKGLIDAAATDPALSEDSLKSLGVKVDALLKQDEPVMRQYTGYLVGHAHIDFQWLWEWPETVQVCRDTFKQALKFMDEFPGFTFTQSSSGLYEATEKSWPTIFKGIQEQVAKGNWEIVGGRVCEGDENMISAESNASQFLYGQRYFREHFKGKCAVVGWEPDTFGHTWQFPQILQLAGCKYFYFCRAGYNLPLFWWQAPDGSRVLAFEQTANGGWYNGDIATERLDRQFNFEKATGSKDMLWVYGVGNHGGGPTRENINSAIEFQKLPFLPTIKFSTAQAFFESLAKYDLSKLPVQATDLNTSKAGGFNGVWTSHSDVKRWNRDAEATTESAEAIAYFASRYGYPYPADELKKNWTDICWNHHHDTMSGTAFHNSYYRTGPIFERVIASSRQIEQDAMTFLAVRVQSDSDGILVFNPCGWTRSDIVTFGEPVTGDSDAVSSHDRERMQNTPDGKCIFLAKDIPAYSYRVYHIEQHATTSHDNDISLSQNNQSLENRDFKVTLNMTGGVSSIYDKRLKREFIAPGGSGNRLEIAWENPRTSSAWTIGHIDRVEPLHASEAPHVAEAGPARITLAWDCKFQSSILHQSISLGQYGPPVFSLATKWNELGSVDHHEPFLKVAFDMAVDSPTATYQIPFATIQKPIDGSERPASKFADFSGGGFGAAILNDCKQGYSASGDTLCLSLIRSAFFPDPRPNDRPQHASWVFMPHDGTGDSPAVAQAAEAFNHPLLCTAFHPLPGASLPPEMTFLTVDKPNVMITAVKRAEDDHDMVVRFYELIGKPTQATFTLPAKPGKIQTVNLIEDPLHDESTPSVPLRGHEIHTLKIAIPDAPGYES
jgi:alpha-mannosidase